MKIAALADVKAHLSAYVDECENEGPVIITRNGKPAAVLLAPRDNDDLERLVLAIHVGSNRCSVNREEVSKLAEACPTTNFGKPSHIAVDPKQVQSRERIDKPVA